MKIPSIRTMISPENFRLYMDYKKIQLEKYYRLNPDKSVGHVENTQTAILERQAMASLQISLTDTTVETLHGKQIDTTVESYKQLVK